MVREQEFSVNFTSHLKKFLPSDIILRDMLVISILKIITYYDSFNLYKFVVMAFVGAAEVLKVLFWCKMMPY